jgi:hypothetical protein
MNGMKKRFTKLTLRLAMIAILLLANLSMFSGIAGAIAPPILTVSVIAPVYEITETTASLNAQASTSLPNSETAQLAIRFSTNQDVPDADSSEFKGSFGETYLHSSLVELDPGTTYYYYAYIEDGSSKTYATTIKSFTTASFTGIDVKDPNGTTFDKTPAFSKNTKSYTVTVPLETVNVNVYENFNFGSSLIPLVPTEFAVVGVSTESTNKPWILPTVSVNSYAVLPLVLTSDVTTVCVKAPAFQMPDGEGPPPIDSCFDNGYDYEVHIIRAEPSVHTSEIYQNYDKYAFLKATTTGFTNSATVGFELSTHENLSESQNVAGTWTSGSGIQAYKSQLTPGTTYFYRAYAQQGVSEGVYGEIQSFTTSAFTGIDVKNANDEILSKTPSEFDPSNKVYTVHVPYNTSTVSVVENVYLGTAVQPLPVNSAIVGEDSTPQSTNWSTPVDGNIYAARQVNVTSNLTTVCFNAPQLSVPATAISPCSSYNYEIQIIRDPIIAVQTMPVDVNTDTSATLKATVSGFTSSASFGFILSEHANMSDSQNVVGTWLSSSEILGYTTQLQSPLTPGTTYYYQAYAQAGVADGVYGEVDTFTTAALTGIDVKNANQETLTKSPSEFNLSQKVYTVHVPHNTASVSVFETVYKGTAGIDPLPATFTTVDDPNDANKDEPWNTSGSWNLVANHEVTLNSSLTTTVCASALMFDGPQGEASPCSNYAYEVQIIRDAPTVVTFPAQMNTDSKAYIDGQSNDASHNATTVGFELDTNADMLHKEDITETWFYNNFSAALENLTPGTTYFYRAFVQDGSTRYYGNIESFTTAKFTGIDVKNGNGTTFAKSPSVFDISNKLYTVHVPYNTTSVNVAQNFFKGTAIPLTPAKFAVVNVDERHDPQTATWNDLENGNTTASLPVALTTNLTTVCMNAPEFQMVSNSEQPINSCDGYTYEIQIIRDSAPDDSPASTPKTVTVIVTEHSGSVTNLPVTQLGESKLPMSAQLFTTDGVSLNLPDIAIKADGTFVLPNVPAGQYHMVLSVVAPTGEKLAGRPATLTVDANGNAQVESELIDPYGIITDEVTGKVIEGAHATLHWADTTLNRSKGRTPGDLVILPILPDFAPNQNKDPQDSNAKGEYGWMVFPDGDYYILATKTGYNDFDSRTTGASKDAGKDSYIENGIIHIGQSIESYDFSMEPIAKEKGTHNNYVAGYPDGTFGPDRNITRAEVAAVFARITNNYQLELPASDVNSFSDVASSHWAKEYIENVRASELMLGTTDSTFNPEAPITRGEVAAIVARYKKLAPVEEAAFSDTADNWANGAINAVKKANIISGYENGTFLPNQNIVRKEFVIMINRMLERGKLQNITKPTWSDVPATNFYFADIEEASTTHNYALYENGAERIKK